MPGKIEGRRRRGRQRMRWSDGFTDSVGMSLSRLWERVKDGEVGCAAVHGVAKSQTRLSNWTTRNSNFSWLHDLLDVCLSASHFILFDVSFHLWIGANHLLSAHVTLSTNCDKLSINRGKFWKRWEHQTAWSASWEICMQVRKQQLELDMEQQTGSKLGKEYIKAVYCHPAYLTYMQRTSWEIPCWMKHKLESRLPGEILIISHRQITPPLWQKVKN